MIKSIRNPKIAVFASAFLPIGLVLALVSAVHAEPLSPDPVPGSVDAFYGSGYNLTYDNTLYEQGLVPLSGYANSGVPPANTIFTNINNPNMTFLMPPSYTANDDLMIVNSSIFGTNDTGTLTFNAPVTATSLAILDIGGTAATRSAIP